MSMHFFLYLTGVPGFMQLALIVSFSLFNVDLLRKNDEI